VEVIEASFHTKLERCIDDERQLKTAKHIGYATVLKRVFRGISEFFYMENIKFSVFVMVT